MTSHLAPPPTPLLFRHQPSLPGGKHHPLSMAALMQSNNEPVAITNPLSGASNTVSSPSDSVAFLKQSSKPESSLSSIASAGLHVSRSRDHLPQPSTVNMTTPPTATTPTMDHRSLEQAKESEQHNSSQVAREALGASEKPQPHSINDSMSLSVDHMQVDSHPNPGNHDAYGPPTDNNNTTSLLNAPTTVASPGPIEDSGSQDGDRPRHRDEADLAEETSNKAFSYPMPTGNFSDSRRGLSLPNSGFNRNGQRSPGSKKYRCPYCATEFTRQHNLKSHLLTHSQEKPYVCQTCHSRFRRLHDLKRHTKLHTGERPHICPKCGRRFARGDALARHNKGQGGCAGRRSSMGSFAADDEYGDGTAHGPAEDTMDGLVYAEPERMDEEDERRLNMPSIRKHDAPSTDSISRSNTATFQSRQPSTYPPIAAGRPSPGGLFPPPTGHGGASSTSPSPISQTGNMTFPPAGQPSGASVFPPSTATTTNNSILESPKPLSPNALSSHNQLSQNPDSDHHRAHSPGMVQQSFQQQPFSRPPPQASVTTHAAPGLGLPPPQPGAPQLPPPPGMNSSDSRFPFHGTGSVAAAAAAKHTPTHSHSSNHSGGPLATSKTSPEVANNSNGLPGPHDSGMLDSSNREDELWTYIRSVHEELTGLRTEVAALRAQLASSNANGTAPDLSTAQPHPSDASAVSAGQR